MPYENCWERHGVVKHFSGFVTADEFVRSAEAIAAHPDFDRVTYIVNDFTGSDGHGIDGDALERIAVIRFGSMSTNRKIRVLVVSTDPRVTALADAVKVAPLIGSQVTVAVPDMDRARLWLLEHPAANR